MHSLSPLRPLARTMLGVLPLLLASLGGCRAPRTSASPAAAAPPFSDVTAAAGIRFRHEHGGQSPLTIVETAGSGCAFLDYDQDGFLDIFLVNGCRRDIPVGRRPPRHALYHNNRDGTFTDVSAKAGFTDQLYGMGCVAADYDGDGYPDLLVTGYEGLALYHNERNGTWREVTAAAGVTDRAWRTSAAFADVDRDGWLDLYVCGYVRVGAGSPRTCAVRGVPMACPPRHYDREPGRFFRNRGDGKFTDVTRGSGATVHGNSLGCVFTDYDDNGYPDLFVANDGIANCLFRNTTRRAGQVAFRDEALEAGVAYGRGGTGDASMGVDAADYDGDGRFDLITTNFQGETDALYRNLGPNGFEHVTARAGLDATRTFLSFGCGFLDYDLDGLPDLFITSGHVQDRIRDVDPACDFAQPRHLYRNEGGHLRAVAGGEALGSPAVGRGAAFGDYDNDGDTDILAANCGGPPMLLRNDAARAHHWLRVRLAGRAPNRHGIGARVTVVSGGRSQIQEVRAGNSYASSGDPRLTFGLGAGSPQEVRVRWPRGDEQVLRAPTVDQELVVREVGAGP